MGGPCLLEQQSILRKARKTKENDHRCENTFAKLKKLGSTLEYRYVESSNFNGDK